MTETRDLTENLMRRLWPSFKRRLEAKFPGEEWIRPLFLLRALRAGPTQVHLLATLPANSRIISAALSRLPVLREMLAPSFNISLTKYPDEYEIAEAQRRFGIDMARTRKDTA